jgi:hypothetical protein
MHAILLLETPATKKTPIGRALKGLEFLYIAVEKLIFPQHFAAFAQRS